MRVLAIETATEACSVALFEGDSLIDARHETIGRGHAERLVPMIAGLPDGGRADEIHVSLGPGSFTGVRIGLAAARALGLAWHAPVRGYPTLSLIATIARQQGAGDVGVCMNGGHGEWFVQPFDAEGLPTASLVSVSPEDAITRLPQETIAGTRASEFAGLATQPVAIVHTLADARYVRRVPSTLLTDSLSPIYGRAPDAKVPKR